MAIKINQWKPDTCSCVIHWYFDDEVQPIVRTFFAVENACPAHQNLLGLSRGQPEWVQPDQTVDTENAARFAMVETSLEQNMEKNLASVPSQYHSIIRAEIEKHDLKAVEMYSGIFAPIDEKALSKGVWDSVWEEVDRKNDTLKDILANGPSSLYDTDGISRTVKQNAGFEFSWSGTSPDRVLTIRFTAVTLTTNQKNALRNILNNRFGIGKVILL